MEVRAATQADIPGLEVVRQQAIEAGFTGEYDRSTFAPLVASPDDRLEGWITADPYRVLVVDTEVTVVSFGVLDCDAGEILGLYTVPNHAEQGCATALVDAFETTAREDGHTELRADATRNAVGFFEARGFERRDTVERPMGGEEVILECVRVVKPL